MKKIILLLLLFLSLSSCNTARAKNKTKLSSGDSESSTNAAKYYLSSDYYFMSDNPDFMGKAMNYAYQEYSGVTVPALVYPSNYCLKKRQVFFSIFGIRQYFCKKNHAGGNLFFQHRKSWLYKFACQARFDSWRLFWGQSDRLIFRREWIPVG